MIIKFPIADMRVMDIFSKLAVLFCLCRWKEVVNSSTTATNVFFFLSFCNRVQYVNFWYTQGSMYFCWCCEL